jgi:hypothetical protein
MSKQSYLTWIRDSVDRKSEVKLPEFSQHTINRMINKRNEKFKTAVNDHIRLCRENVWA